MSSATAQGGQRQGLVALACGHVRAFPWDDARGIGQRGGLLACPQCPQAPAAGPRHPARAPYVAVITHAQLQLQQRCTVCLESYGPPAWACQCNRPSLMLRQLCEQYEQHRGPLEGDPYDADLWADEAYTWICALLNRKPEGTD